MKESMEKLDQPQVIQNINRVLIRTSNTKTIAEIIHNNVGGTMVALELTTPYPENYGATVQQVVGKMKQAIYRL
jgi:hypothetical protein